MVARPESPSVLRSLKSGSSGTALRTWTAYSRPLFAAHLTGKKPAVVIYNTDGKIGRYEHRIKVACERAGVAFYSVP